MSALTQQEKKQGLPLFIDWAKALGVPIITLIVSIYGQQIVENARQNQKVLEQIERNQIEFKLRMEAFQELQDAKNSMFEKELQGIKKEIEYWRK